jgi:uncharacterized protein YndB with AHSA1/START domain
VKFYEVATNIKASPERIWSLITDAPHYPDWNTTVEKVEGKIAPGETITLKVKVNPGRAFPIKVTEFKPSERMVWSSGMPLTPAGNGETRFHMREEYSGPMLGMIWKSIPDLGPAFQEFAQSLKRAAEKTA